MKSRAINYLKCLAALLVIHTHLGKLYPSSLSFLVWGGYFANCIFFFVSGYCLNNVKVGFPKWYGKRFIRVYSSYLLFLPLLFFAGYLSGLNWINVVMPFKQYHFIPSILVLYIVFYVLDVINQKTKFKYLIQIPVFAIVAIVWFILFFDTSLEPIDVHYTLFEFIIYLIPMLLGGMAKEGKWIKNKKVSFALAAVTFLIYMCNSFRPFTGDLKIIKPIVGLLFTYGLSCFVLSFEEVLPKVKVIDFIATITLECYIVQYISRDAFLTIGFPTNIIYHTVCTIAMAYCLHKISNFIVNKVTKQDKKNSVLT